MTKKSTIYTKTGDKGTTKLYSGKTVSKNNKQVHVLGQFDHLNSHIGQTYEKIKSVFNNSWVGLADRVLTYIPVDHDDLISAKAFGLVFLISAVWSLFLTTSFVSSVGLLTCLIVMSHKVISVLRKKCADYKSSIITLKHLETIMFDIKNIMTLVANPVNENNHRYVDDPSVSVETFQKIMLGIPVDEKKFVETYNNVNSLFNQMIAESNITNVQREEFFAKGFIRENNYLVYTGPVPPETKVNIPLDLVRLNVTINDVTTDSIAPDNISLSNVTANSEFISKSTVLPGVPCNATNNTSDLNDNSNENNIEQPTLNRETFLKKHCVFKESSSEPNAKLISRIKEQFAEHSLTNLEEMIDIVDISEEHPIRCFLFPVGSELTAQIHIVRTLCRSVELDLYSSGGEDVYNIQCGQEYNLLIAKYMNRLSSYLFVLSRWATVVVAKEKELEFDQYKNKK